MRQNNLTIEADLNRHFSRYEDPLWDEDEVELSKRVIRVRMSKNNEGFVIELEHNNKPVYFIEESKISKKYVKFLQSGEGLQFIISQYKKGVKNLSQLKKSLVEQHA